MFFLVTLTNGRTPVVPAADENEMIEWLADPNEILRTEAGTLIPVHHVVTAEPMKNRQGV